LHISKLFRTFAPENALLGILTFETSKTIKTFLTYKHYDLQQRGTGNVPSS
jgi:hypothetical protein